MKRYHTFEYKGGGWHFAMHYDEGGYFGGLHYRHYTPSQCERWSVLYSDKRRFPTPEEADEAFRAPFDDDFLQAERNATAAKQLDT
jgi:hypothetical protein